MILIVNDSDMVQEMLADKVERIGYKYKLAANGVEALDKLDDSIGLILCDFSMPQMDGLRFRMLQKRVSPETPFILICAQKNIERLAAEMEADAYFDLIQSVACSDLLTEVIHKHYMRR